VNRKTELKRFLEYTNANNSYKLRVLVKNKMIIRSSSSRIATLQKLTKILGISISINKKRIKRMNLASFIELNLRGGGRPLLDFKFYYHIRGIQGACDVVSHSQNL
jgi:hypothetical protein